MLYSYRIHIREYLEQLSNTLRWDKLGAVGRSNLGRLTILIPFVGYLIIFNPSFVNFFRQELPGGIPNTFEWFSDLHELRLVYLYFGLLFLGLGNLLFVILAPEALRKHSDVSGYIQEMENVASPSLIGNKLDDTVARFQNANDGEAASPFFSGQSLSFPGEPSGYLHDLIVSIYRSVPADELPDDTETIEEPLGTMFLNSPYTFHTGSGYTNTELIMKVLTTGNTAAFLLQRAFHQAAIDKSKEVFFVEYYSLGYSRFFVRVLVGFLFFAGFFALLVPTVTTSVLVLLSAFQTPI